MNSESWTLIRDLKDASSAVDELLVSIMASNLPASPFVVGSLSSFHAKVDLVSRDLQRFEANTFAILDK